MSPGLFPRIAAVLALAVLGVRAWTVDYPYSIDFQTYWLAGSRVLHGESARLYAAAGGDADGIPAALAAAEFKNLPIVAVAFAPLALFDYPTAKRVFWWLSLLALAATAWVVGRYLVPPALGPPEARALGALAVLAVMAPAHISLRHGQTTPWVALLVAGALAFVTAGREGRGGAALAGASAVKFPPLALVLLFTQRARFRVVAGWALGLAVIVGASVFVFGVDLHRDYVRGVLAQRGTVMPGHNNQSLVAVATRLSDPTLLNDWQPVLASKTASWAAGAATLALFVAVGWGLRARRDLALESTAVLALGIVVFPVAWDHYFLLLGPGLMASAAGLLVRGERGLLWGLGVAFFLVAVPTPAAWLDRHATSGWVDGLMVSHYFVGAIVALGVALAALRRP